MAYLTDPDGSTTGPARQKRVAEHYDKIWTDQESESWESWPFFRREPSALSYALDSLGDIDGRRVLDVACGAGYSSQTLAGRGAQVFPLDLSAQGLSKTRRRLAQAGLVGRANPVLASVEQLPYADASFEAVFAQNFLMHVDAAAVGREIYRVLKPGGVAVFVEPLAHHPLVRIYRRFFSSYKGTRPRWSTRADLAGLAQLFQRSAIRGFYLTAALASTGFIQKYSLLLRTLFGVTNALDRLIIKFIPKAEQFSWVAVIKLEKIS